MISLKFLISSLRPPSWRDWNRLPIWTLDGKRPIRSQARIFIGSTAQYVALYDSRPCTSHQFTTHVCIRYLWVLLHNTIIDPHHWFHARWEIYIRSFMWITWWGKWWAAFWERGSIFVRLSPEREKVANKWNITKKRNFSIRHPKTFQGAENASHAVKDSQSNPGIRRSREA